MKMSDVFELPVNICNMENSDPRGHYNDLSESEQDNAADKAINNHDLLIEALEWTLERAEPEVNEAAVPMDQINLIKYQALLKELQS